ncbi:hypothetical protein O181_049690 [Austropuccinia psidii MF-1]|uniref:Uncharacterized protein n=1 Tax=Austropuccinia psidii MF-1 TaxID=1389203 RepID=A0A9Q3DZM6_9BASI|nr:hypothetical protein [Austropuccinia psidii MF-1]
MLSLCPHDMPPMLPPHVGLHLSLCFRPPPLRMLTLAQDPQYMPPTLPPHVYPHPSLPFWTPSTYHAYAPTGPSRYASEASTLPHASTPPLLTMLMLLQDPLDMPLTLQPHVHPHPSLLLSTPTAYHAYAPAGPSKYASDNATPCPPSPILMLPHPCG